MKREIRHRGVRVPSQSAHRFEAEGHSPFIKVPRGFFAQWQLSESIQIAASGGLLCTPKRIATIGTGVFKIVTMNLSPLRVEYRGPVYLLKYEKLRKVIRARYDLEIRLGPQWRENIWPHLFDCYMKNGEWPLKKKDYVKVFRELLAAVDSARMPAGDGTTGRIRRLRRRVASASLTRFDRARSAEKLAAGSDRITHKLLETEFFEELLAEMDMIRSIDDRQSIVPLVGECVRDEIRIRLPFEVAQAHRLMIYGPTRVEYMWEYGEAFSEKFLCSSLELYPTAALVLSPRAKILAPRMKVPLDDGGKHVYGITLDAPMICKGENVRLEFPEPPRQRFSSLRRQSPAHAPDIDPADMYVKLQGTEA